jgi:bifunctional ADP-heptose synthase (sugar kinase/adenylyltransferase)
VTPIATTEPRRESREAVRPDDPLTTEVIETILKRLPKLKVGVLGDLFLDRYLDIDASLTEPSIETGLDAYQVTRVRSYPGAVGTVVSNLAALGVGRIVPLAIIGDDGEGCELRQALDKLAVVDTTRLFNWNGRRTPTYTKPMLHRAGEPPRELNRLDIKNRTPLPSAAEDLILAALDKTWDELHALIVLDQVSEIDCGVVTARVRERIAELGAAHPERLILADSRERIALFRHTALKPNRQECLTAIKDQELTTAVTQLSRRARRPVFCTCGDEGILLADPERMDGTPVRIAGYRVEGPTDPVGAGDSTSAGIVCARAAGATLEQAAAFGCLVASITVQQIGTTGTVTPDKIAAARARW